MRLQHALDDVRWQHLPPPPPPPLLPRVRRC
jgi:hypothetical protein